MLVAALRYVLQSSVQRNISSSEHYKMTVFFLLFQKRSSRTPRRIMTTSPTELQQAIFEDQLWQARLFFLKGY